MKVSTCPKCEKEGLLVFNDGTKNCFNCGYFEE